MKKGFTLVELSIVLVIIGLLVGGILAAQSMLSTARINAVIKEVQQFDAAVSNFRVKYNSLPGDTDKMSPGGDNDGIIEDNSGIDTNAQYFSGETANLWVHLNISGFMPGILFSSTVTNYFNSDPNALNGPVSKYGSQTSTVAYSSPMAKNWYRIGSYKNLHLDTDKFSEVTEQSTIKGYEVLAIDQKIDDGLITSGSPRKMFGVAYRYPLSSQICTVDLNCTIFIKILSQVDQSNEIQ